MRLILFEEIQWFRYRDALPEDPEVSYCYNHGPVWKRDRVDAYEHIFDFIAELL